MSHSSWSNAVTAMVALSAVALLNGCGATPAPEQSDSFKPAGGDAGKTEVKKEAAKPKATGGKAYTDADAKGTLSGVVKLAGDAPKRAKIEISDPKCAAEHGDGMRKEDVVSKDGMLQNAIVYIKEAPAFNFDDYKAPDALINQKGCQYVPHVLAVMVGQELAVKSEDAMAHNIHGLPNVNAGFNYSQTAPGILPTKIKFKEAEPAFVVKCDIHPWMGAQVYVFDNPFHAVSAEDGKYEIKLPAGEYEVMVWHESAKLEVPAAQKIKIEDGKTATLDLTVKVK